jgi:isopentenyl diphosphate isomerase/L-lactate dehydrogenase-like FMN-dependent dehydrogenase
MRTLVAFRTPSLHPTRTRVERAQTIDDLRTIARRRTPRVAFDYADGAAGTESSLLRARDAFAAVQFRQFVLRDVSKVELQTPVGDSMADLPFGIAPTGLTRLLHHEGERAGASVADEFGIPFCLSTMGTVSLEEIRDLAPSADRWFQLYLWKDRDKSVALIDRARVAGYRTLMLTVDTAVGGSRLRDIRNGMTIPPAFGPAAVADVMTRPAWLYNMLTTDPLAFASLSKYPGSVATLIDEMFDSTLTFADLRWLRDIWPGRLVVKGIQSAEDAVRAVDCGADAVLLSSHGGRQLDRAPTPLLELPVVRQALASSAEIYLDSGIMCGADIVAAHALGADFTFVGRAYLYGLMAGGRHGVARAVQILTAEITRTLQLMGVPRIQDLTPDHVTLAAAAAVV